jgi:uncharacterized protein (TIGR03435 family)
MILRAMARLGSGVRILRAVGLTDGSACPTSPLKNSQKGGAAAFASQPILSRLLSLILVAVAPALCQKAADLPSFDVASVKPSPESGPGQSININLGTARHGEVTLQNTNVSDCVRFAYGLVSDEQVSGPDWIRSYQFRFDIDAKAPPDTPREQLLRMMQRLLAERFHLVLHREPRPVARLDLEVAKGGPKLHASLDSTVSGLVAYRPGQLAYNHIPLNTLAVLLSRQLKQPVIDNTGIAGFFDIKLEWLPDNPPRPSTGPDGAKKAAIPDDMDLRPDIFHAVQAQLGLKLETRRTPIDVLVIDHVDQVPVGN